jgi:bifunctional DNase/RNase
VRRTPKDFIEVSYNGIVNIRGPSGSLPVILLKDDRGRTMAIPITSLESDLLRHALEGSDKGPLFYQTLPACLSKLHATLVEVRILYSSDYDLPTRLLLHDAHGREIEITIPCPDGIAYAHLTQAPILVAEKLMTAVCASSGEAGSNG